MSFKKSLSSRTILILIPIRLRAPAAGRCRIRHSDSGSSGDTSDLDFSLSQAHGPRSRTAVMYAAAATACETAHTGFEPTLDLEKTSGRLSTRQVEPRRQAVRWAQPSSWPSANSFLSACGMCFWGLNLRHDCSNAHVLKSGPCSPPWQFGLCLRGTVFLIVISCRLPL